MRPWLALLCLSLCACVGLAGLDDLSFERAADGGAAAGGAGGGVAGGGQGAAAGSGGIAPAVTVLDAADAPATYVMPAGSDRLLFLFALMEDTTATAPGLGEVTSFRYGGRAMTRLPTVGRATVVDMAGGGNAVEAWYALEADLSQLAGDAIEVTYNKSSLDETPFLTVVALAGVDQAQPFGGGDTAMALDAASIGGMALENRAGDLLVAAADAGDEGTYATSSSLTILGEQSSSSHAGCVAAGLASGSDASLTLTLSRTANRMAFTGFVVRAAGL